jgi:hypothetical protein
VANRDYIPSTDEGKRVWARNLATLVAATPAAFSVPVPVATAYTATVDEYDAALTAALEPSTRGPSTITTKNTKRAALVAASRSIVATIQGTPGLTATQKQDLAISQRDFEPSPIPAPTAVPVAKIIKVDGWTIDVQITTAGSTRRGLPDGVAGINIYSFQGAVAPTDPAEWTYEGESSRSRFQIAAPPTLPAGSKVWYTFCFKSPRFQTGPACAGVAIIVGGGVPETIVG